MKQRDNEISRAHNDFRDQKLNIKRIQAKIAERNEVYENQLKLNKEYEKNITVAERKVVNLKYEPFNLGKNKRKPQLP
jgi:hypothetical protein